MRLRFYAAIFAAVLITVSGQYLFGRLADSRGNAARLAAAGTSLASMPTQVGAWRTTRETPLPQPVLNILRCTSYVNRAYMNTDSGKIVNVTLLVGPAETMVVHRPEVCMTGGGLWEMKGVPTRIPLALGAGPEQEFYRSDFQARSLDGGLMRVYYAWNRTGHWEAPDSPRITLGGAARLYKLYVATEIIPGETGETDAATTFLRDFFPIVEQQLSAELSPASG